MKTELVAHRGASYLANHENTIEAFQLALDMHVDCIEFDVRQTFDKVLIVYHDEQINGIPVSTITYQELNAITRTLGYQVPTMKEVLTLCVGKARLLIELKEAGYEKRVITLVTSMFDYDAYSMQSFLDIVVRRIKKLDSNIHTGLLLGQRHVDFRTHFNEFFPLRRLAACHADFVSVHYGLATPDFVYRMHRANIPVYVWTVDQIRLQSHFLALNVNGLITNRPESAIYLRTKRESYLSETKEK